eukprot:GHVH01003097.1.p1 GENE.GHVH01003097.1~~GHVH01003097.1.p1  ORF type:complete len:134 (+),score=18.43 GHVH01003097.1:42-404(+)
MAASGKDFKSVKKTTMSRSKRAGVTFPVGRFSRFLRNGRYAKRVGSTAPIFIAAVMEYLTAEVLELSGNMCKEEKKARIRPRHISIAVRTDEELGRLLNSVTISSGGVLQKTKAELSAKV